MTGYKFMKKKLVSIIITAHNQEEFLRDCLNSFYNQKTTHSYELILIDDDSKDNTEELVKKHYPEVGYFKVHFNNACKTRNYGLTKANGDYIGWFDGDDFPADNYIEELANELDKDENIDFVQPRIYYKGHTIENNFINICDVWEFSPSLHKVRGCFTTHSLLRREVAKKLKWDEKMGKEKMCYDDWDYFLTAIEKGFKGKLSHKARFFYRQNNKSLWGQMKQETIKKSMEYLLKKHSIREDIDKVNYTFVSVISREYCLDKYFECIKELEMPRKRMHWLVYVDNDDEEMIERIRKFAEEEGQRFYSWRMFATMRRPITDGMEKRIERLRSNFKTILREIKDPLIGTPYFFMLEDDTIVKDKRAFYKLNKYLKDNVAIVSGVESTRGNIKVLGVAKLKWKGNRLLERYCLKPKKKGVEEVDATGWYCFVGRTDAFKEEYISSVVYTWAANDIICSWKLRQAGWKILVNWSIWCAHIFLQDRKIKEIMPDEAKEEIFVLEKL